MVTPFCVCWDWYSQSDDLNHYYDSFAIITKDNINFEKIIILACLKIAINAK